MAGVAVVNGPFVLVILVFFDELYLCEEAILVERETHLYGAIVCVQGELVTLHGKGLIVMTYACELAALVVGKTVGSHTRHQQAVAIYYGCRL